MMRHCNAQLEATTRVAYSPAARGRGWHPDHESQTTTTSDRRSIPPTNPTEGQINRPTTHASEDVAPPTSSMTPRTSVPAHPRVKRKALCSRTPAPCSPLPLEDEPPPAAAVVTRRSRGWARWRTTRSLVRERHESRFIFLVVGRALSNLTYSTLTRARQILVL
jgi:hypothetical protein